MPEEKSRFIKALDEFEKGKISAEEVKKAGVIGAEEIRRAVEAAGRQQHEELKAEANRIHEEYVRQPKNLDSILDKEAFREATNKRDKIGMYNAEIMVWDDGYGNIIYLNPDVSMRQVQVVSARITEQKRVFDTLGAGDQTQIRAAFSLATPAESTTPYQDFFKSEALGIRYQELKQKSTPIK